MRFYHFTPISNKDGIEAEGIIPRVTAEVEAMMGIGGVGAVMLCNTETTAIDKREMAMLQRRYPDRPFISKRWMRWDTDEPLVRFTLSVPANYIPPHARGNDYYGVKKYGPWLLERWKENPPAKTPDPKDPAMRRAITSWWIGIETRITPDMIRAVDIEQPKPATEPAKARSQ